jgi:hypothetical protein
MGADASASSTSTSPDRCVFRVVETTLCTGISVRQAGSTQTPRAAPGPYLFVARKTFD